MTTITKAMLLAAGLGTRLRPLTHTTPKPLLPLNDHCLIDYTIGYLARWGIREIMINLHHLGDQIMRHVGDGSRYGIRAHFSKEPKLLGTGGGIRNAEDFFGGEPFIVLNSDALLDVDLAAMVEHHAASGVAATMALKPLGTDGYQPVTIDERGMVAGFNGTGRHFYVGLQILTQRLLDILPPGGEISCLIQDGYAPFIAGGGRVSSFIYNGYFNDVGTAERYEQARRDVASGTVRLFNQTHSSSVLP